MKLTEDVLNRTVDAQKKHRRMKAIFFENFRRGAEFLTDEEGPIKELMLGSSPEENYFDIFFLEMQIRFRFFTCYGADDALTGKVVVLRQSPALSKIPDVIGGFSFDAEGITDIEAAEGNGKIEIGRSAQQIILHFIDQALLKPLPLPAAN